VRLFIAGFAFVGVEYLGFEETKEETWTFDSRIRCCQKERNRSGRKERNLSLSLSLSLNLLCLRVVLLADRSFLGD
jgi:hypothetical protein